MGFDEGRVDGSLSTHPTRRLRAASGRPGRTGCATLRVCETGVESGAPVVASRRAHRHPWSVSVEKPARCRIGGHHLQTRRPGSDSSRCFRTVVPHSRHHLLHESPGHFVGRATATGYAAKTGSPIGCVVSSERPQRLCVRRTREATGQHPEAHAVASGGVAGLAGRVGAAARTAGDASGLQVADKDALQVASTAQGSATGANSQSGSISATRRIGSSQRGWRYPPRGPTCTWIMPKISYLLDSNRQVALTRVSGHHEVRNCRRTQKSPEWRGRSLDQAIMLLPTQPPELLVVTIHRPAIVAERPERPPRARLRAYYESTACNRQPHAAGRVGCGVKHGVGAVRAVDLGPQAGAGEEQQ